MSERVYRSFRVKRAAFRYASAMESLYGRPYIYKIEASADGDQKLFAKFYDVNLFADRVSPRLHDLDIQMRAKPIEGTDH